MADTDSRDRTESPTQKRIEDARRRGQVPRSRDLGAAAVTLVFGLAIVTFGMPTMGAAFTSLLADAFDFTRALTAAR
jgi:flagellar biosynthetic protein FlhB